MSAVISSVKLFIFVKFKIFSLSVLSVCDANKNDLSIFKDYKKSSTDTDDVSDKLSAELDKGCRSASVCVVM